MIGGWRRRRLRWPGVVTEGRHGWEGAVLAPHRRKVAECERVPALVWGEIVGCTMYRVLAKRNKPSGSTRRAMLESRR